MNNIDDVIKGFNLFFTDTLNRNNCNLNDLGNKEVNYNNCISLYDLIENFNKIYLSFKNEYENMDKLNIGDNIIFIELYKLSGYHHEELLLHVSGSKITPESDIFLHLINDGDNVSSYYTKALNIFDKKYFIKLDLDKAKIKKIIDLYDKYNVLLKIYHSFKNDMIFGDGAHVLTSKIESYNDSLTNLKKFKINMFFDYGKIGASITINVLLGNEFGIDEKECSIRTLGFDIENNFNYQEMLKKVYLNERYLNNYFDRLNGKEDINIKKLTKNIDLL